MQIRPGGPKTPQSQARETLTGHARLREGSSHRSGLSVSEHPIPRSPAPGPIVEVPEGGGTWEKPEKPGRKSRPGISRCGSRRRVRGNLINAINLFYFFKICRGPFIKKVPFLLCVGGVSEKWDFLNRFCAVNVLL